MNAPLAREDNVVRVLARGLSILRAFTPKNAWKSNQEIAAQTALPRPTVSRLTANLTSLGYLEYSAERSAYRLGPSVLALGFAALANVDVRVAARPHMQALADDADLLVTLGMRDGMAMIATEVCHSAHRLISLRLNVGARLPLPKSALGRALTGALPREARERLLAEIRASFPAEWPQLERELAEAVDHYATHGFAFGLSSIERGVNGIAVMLETPCAPHIYAIGCAAPTDLATEARLAREIAPRLLAIKQAIERQVAKR